MTEHCRIDDPRRCHGITDHGQCQVLAVENSNFCDKHYRQSPNGGRPSTQLKKQEIRRYKLDNAKLQQSLDQQYQDDDYLNLKDEILLLQMLVKERLGMIRTDADLIMAVGQVNTMIQRLESMKVALLKIQQQLGFVLTKDQVRKLGMQLADLMAEEFQGVDDKDERINRVCIGFINAIQNASQGEQHE